MHLKATESTGRITLTNEMGGVAHVTIADVKQSNGVIYVIDKVLLRKMWSGAIPSSERQAISHRVEIDHDRGLRHG